MSFLSQHIAQETGTMDPVLQTHHDDPNHQPPEPAKTTERVVMDDKGKEVKETK